MFEVSLSGHRMDHLHMRPKRTPKGGKLIVLNIIFLASLSDNTIDSRVVYMADFGKQVMLHLKIKATEYPGQYLTLRRKVGCRLDLVYHPFLFDLGFVDGLKFRFLNHMCQLKHRCQTHAAYCTCNQ